LWEPTFGELGFAGQGKQGSAKGPVTEIERTIWEEIQPMLLIDLAGQERWALIKYWHQYILINYYSVCMDSPLKKVTVSLQGDDLSSRSSSYIFNRIVRKPDERSSSKRSNSRKSLESTTELSKFYIKMGSGRESQPNVEERR